MADLSTTGLHTEKNKHLQGVTKNGVIGAIKQASARTGVDFAYLMDKAAQESSFNPQAKSSTSSASGLYQFIGQTWLRMVKQHGAEYGLADEAAKIKIDKNGVAQVEDRAAREKILNMRYDPVLSSAMAAEFTRENKDYLEAKLDTRVGNTELYLAHFLGAGGAEKFLKSMRANPNASAAELLPDAAEANRSVFYGKNGHALSFNQIYNRFAAKFKEGNEEAENMLAANKSDALLPAKLPSLTSEFFYMPDVSPELTQFKQNSTTSETLFNVMVMAQQNISATLSNAYAAFDEKRKI